MDSRRQPVRHVFVLVYVTCVGEVKVTLTDVKGVAVPFKLVDNKDKTYRVEFSTSVVGVLTATVLCASQPATGSPYKITVEAGVDMSKVQVKGLPESTLHCTVCLIYGAGIGLGLGLVALTLVLTLTACEYVTLYSVSCIWCRRRVSSPNPNLNPDYLRVAYVTRGLKVFLRGWWISQYFYTKVT